MSYRQTAQQSPGRQQPQSAQAQEDDSGSCCFILRALGIGTGEPEQPTARAEAYQAPVVTPPPQSVALRTLEEDGREDGEHRSLLPKKLSELSAPVSQQDASSSRAPVSQRQSGTQELYVGRSGSRPASQSSVTQPQHHRTESGERLRHMQQQAAGHRKAPSYASGDFPRAGILDSNSAGLKLGIQKGDLDPEDDDSHFCPTCLEPYTDENPKTFTECGHHFHLPCLYEWLERKDVCPLCESKISFPGMQID